MSLTGSFCKTETKIAVVAFCRKNYDICQISQNIAFTKKCKGNGRRDSKSWIADLLRSLFKASFEGKIISNALTIIGVSIDTPSKSILIRFDEFDNIELTTSIRLS